MKIQKILGTKGVYLMDDGTEVPFKELKQAIKESKQTAPVEPEKPKKKRGRKKKVI